MATNRTEYKFFKIESGKLIDIMDSETLARRAFVDERNKMLKNRMPITVRLSGSIDQKKWEIIRETNLN